MGSIWNLPEAHRFLPGVVQGQLTMHEQGLSKSEHSMPRGDRIQVANEDVRRTQQEQFSSVVRYVDNATTANELVEIVDAYAQDRWRSRRVRDVAGTSPQALVLRLLARGGEVREDPRTGTASPEQIADLVRPAIEGIIGNKHLRTIYSRTLSGEPTKLDHCVSRGASAMPDGTAEHIAGAQIVTSLAEGGNKNLSNSDLLLRLGYPGAEYLTRKALGYLRARGIAGNKTPPVGFDSLKKVDWIVGTTLAAAARPDHGGNSSSPEITDSVRIARQFYKGYLRLRGADTYRGVEGILAVTSTLALANAVTPQLNEVAKFHSGGTEELKKFDKDDFSQMPAAFCRILFAIDPELLTEATETAFYGGSNVRLKMVYLEALSQRWLETTGQRGQTIGDYVLRLAARGEDPETIATNIEVFSRRHTDKLATE